MVRCPESGDRSLERVGPVLRALGILSPWKRSAPIRRTNPRRSPPGPQRERLTARSGPEPPDSHSRHQRAWTQPGLDRRSEHSMPRPAMVLDNFGWALQAEGLKTDLLGFDAKVSRVVVKEHAKPTKATIMCAPTGNDPSQRHRLTVLFLEGQQARLVDLRIVP
jgi:hypothetical protein